MNVLLHVGAHRCATTSFQRYLRHNLPELASFGVAVWGPRKTRNGLFSGLIPGEVQIGGQAGTRRAIGRIRLARAAARAAGTQTLLVSDENMLGSMRGNVRMGELYSGAGERVARFAEAFGDDLSEVVISIRSPDRYWASVLGFLVSRGYPVPGRRTLERIATATRSWRDVIEDVACAAGPARVRVLTFEGFAGRPEAQLSCLTGTPAPRKEARTWANRTPDLAGLRAVCGDRLASRLPEGDGRWLPYEGPQGAALREAYADDLHWLHAGADGLARLGDEIQTPEAGSTRSGPETTRGSDDDNEERRMAQARRG